VARVELGRSRSARVANASTNRRQWWWVRQGPEVNTDPTITAIGTPQDKAELPAIGQPVGKYLVVDELGSGAMGVVYLASDGQLGRHIALKVLIHHSRGHQLLAEARALARLQHPNVVAIHDVGWWNEHVYMAMEYVQGPSLAEWLSSHVQPGDRLAAFVQAAQGLAAAHRAGIVHYDVKPSNIMVGDDGRVRLVDFGLARSPSPDAPQGSPGGTPRYMSPEQRRGDAVDARTDQFSLCLALYEALYGEHPFAGETADERDDAVRAGRVKTPSTGAIPAATRDAILKGLAFHPDARHRTMEELLAALSPPPARRSRWLAVAAGTACVATIGAALLVQGRGGDPPALGKWDAILAASELPPEQLQPLPGDPMHVTVHRLRNGLTVYLSPNHEKPRVRAMFRFRGGHGDDLGAAGIAQGMSYKGTERIGTVDYATEKPLLDQIRELERRRVTAGPAERARVEALSDALATLASAFEVPNEYSRVLQELGVSQNHGHTDSDSTWFEVEVASNRLEAWADLEADRWTHPVFRLFRSQVAETIGWDRNASASTDSRLSSALIKTMFAGHPYGVENRAIRDATAVRSQADVERFFRSHFVPNNAELILAGDVDPVTTIPVLERAFAAWEPRPLPAHTRQPLKPFAGAAPITIASTGERKVLKLRRGPSKRDLELPAFEVAQELVQRLGRERLAEYGIGWFNARLTILDEAGLFAVVAYPDHESVEDAIPALDAVLARVRAGDFSDDLLASAKRSLRATELLLMRDNAGRVASIADRTIGTNWRDRVERDAKRERVTRADVIRIASNLLASPSLLLRVEPGKVELDSVELPHVPPVLFPDRRSEASLALAHRDVVPIQPKFLVAGSDYEERDTPAGHVIVARDAGSEVFELHALYAVGSHEIPFLCTALTARNVGLPRKLAEAGITYGGSCEQNVVDIQLAGLDRDLPRALEILDRATSELSVEDWEQAKVSVRHWVAGLRSDPTWIQSIVEAAGVYGSSTYFSGTMYVRPDTPASDGLRALQTLARSDRTIGYSGPRAIDELVRMLPPRPAVSKVPPRPAKLDGGAPRVVLLHVPTASNHVNVSIVFGLTHMIPREGELSMYEAYWGSDLNPLAHRLRGTTTLGGELVWPTRRDEPGYLALRASTDASHVTEVVGSTLAELFDAKPDPALVERAKAGIEERLRSNWNAMSQVPVAVWLWQRHGDRIDPRPAAFARLASEGPRTMDAITDELRRAPRVIVVWGDLSRVDRAALAKLGPVRELAIDDIVGVR
jgi:predicted Zn-dependent peptidase/predicted Ser/Thr protein kinase